MQLKVQTVRCLLSAATDQDINACDRNGDTLLHLVAKHERHPNALKILKALVELRERKVDFTKLGSQGDHIKVPAESKLYSLLEKLREQSKDYRGIAQHNTTQITQLTLLRICYLYLFPPPLFFADLL